MQWVGQALATVFSNKAVSTITPEAGSSCVRVQVNSVNSAR